MCDYYTDSDDCYTCGEDVEDMEYIEIDSWTGKEIPGYSAYDSNEESERKLTVKEMLKILEVESKASQYKLTDSVLSALKMYQTSSLKGEWRKELIDYFWDLRNNPRNFCCHRHSEKFPAHPWDVKSLKGDNSKTVRQELEKQLVCSCNRRHLARWIVEVLNP